MRTIETCPLCLGRGTRRRSDGIYRPGRTNPRDRYIACHGDGGIEFRRLQQLVLTGVVISSGRKVNRGRAMR